MIIDPEDIRKALAEAGAGPAGDEGLLEQLRQIEARLYSREVVDQVRRLPEAERQRFVAARLQLTAAVARMNAAALRRIRQQAGGHQGSLEQGVQSLDRTLYRIDAAADWAAAINGVVGSIGEVLLL